jgi:pyrimidine deaminase RibD-like protein
VLVGSFSPSADELGVKPCRAHSSRCTSVGPAVRVAISQLRARRIDVTTYEQRHALMSVAILEAELSTSEDKRLHPKVGAILIDQQWRILARAHRNERGNGDHAERILLQKAFEAQIDLAPTTLIVTLEPCSSRSEGKGKIPCADRVITSGIREVWIGTLDPDPRMRGLGEEMLRFAGIRVERFPDDLTTQVRAQSVGFIAQFAAHYRAG